MANTTATANDELDRVVRYLTTHFGRHKSPKYERPSPATDPAPQPKDKAEEVVVITSPALVVPILKPDDPSISPTRVVGALKPANPMPSRRKKQPRPTVAAKPAVPPNHEHKLPIEKEWVKIQPHDDSAAAPVARRPRGPTGGHQRMERKPAPKPNLMNSAATEPDPPVVLPLDEEPRKPTRGWLG